MAKRDLESTFEFQCRAAGLVIKEREYRFHPVRRWRIDFAWPDMKYGVEIEGLSSKISRHTTIKGYRNDCEKYNTALLMGWRILRFTDREVTTGTGLTMLEDLFNAAL